MKKAALVTVVDKGWLEYAKALFAGAHFNAGWKYDYILMTHNIPNEELDWFREKGIIIYQCEDLQKHINVHSAALTTTMYRLYLFTDFFKQWEHILFIDADVIIYGSLEPLLQHTGFMAAEDSNRNTLDWQLKGEKSVLNIHQKQQYTDLRHNFNIHSPTFNAGVLSIHHSIIQQNTFTNLCSLYASHVDLFAAHMYDQVLLNIYFYKQWIVMPAQFNIFVNFCKINYNRSIMFIDVYIMHFAGAKPWDKPWHNKNKYYKVWQKLYIKSNLMNISRICAPKKESSLEDITRTSAFLSDGWVRVRKKISQYHYWLWRLKTAFKH